MPLLDTNRYQPDSLDTLTNGNLDGQAAPGRNAWTAASGTFSVVTSPGSEYSGQKALRANGTPTGSARLRVWEYPAAVEPIEFKIEVFLRSTWGVDLLQGFRLQDSISRKMVHIFVAGSATDYQIRWVNSTGTQITYLPKADYDDTFVELRLVVDPTTEKHTAYVDGVIATDAVGSVGKIVNADAQWIVNSEDAPADINNFWWFQSSTASLDIRKIRVAAANPIIILPHDGDLAGVSHEAWLYLDDDTHKYSTKGVRDGGETYEPRIVSISPITAELGSEYGGASNSPVTVTLSNRTARGSIPSSDNLEFSKLFDNLSGNEWFGRKLEIYIRRVLANGDIDRVKLFTGLLSGVSLSGAECVVVAGPRSAELFGTINPIEITAGRFPDADANSIGAFIPIVTGDPTQTPATGKPGAVPAYIIEDAAGANPRTLACAAHKTVSGDSFNVWYFNGSTWLTATVSSRDEADTTYGGTITTCVLDAGSYDPSYQYATDVTGVLDAADSTINSPIEAMRKIGVDYGGLSNSDYGDTVYTAEVALDNESLTIANVITEPMPFKEWLNSFLDAYDLDIYFDRDGKIALSWFVPTVVSPTVYTDLSDIYGEPSIKCSTQTGNGRRSIFNQIFSKYGYVASVDDWAGTSLEDDFTSQANLLRTIRNERDNLFVNSQSQITRIDRHRLEYRGRPLQIVTATLSTRLIVPTFPTHVIGLTHYAGLNNAGGGWDSEPFYIESVSYNTMTHRVDITAVRYLDWLQDAYLIIDETKIQTVVPGSAITVVAASPTVSGFSSAETAAMAVGNIIQIKTADNPITAFVGSIDTGAGTIEMEDTDGAAVNANANETTSSYVVKKSWTQMSATNQQYGGLAKKVTRTEAGTVDTTISTTTLTGNATTFVTDGVIAGDEIKIRGSSPMQAFVKSVESETSLTMTATAPATAATVDYTIYEGGAKIGTYPGKRL